MTVALAEQHVEAYFNGAEKYRYYHVFIVGE